MSLTAGDVMWDARVIKSPEELQIIETSASLADGCWEHNSG